MTCLNNPVVQTELEKLDLDYDNTKACQDQDQEQDQDQHQGMPRTAQRTQIIPVQITQHRLRRHDLHTMNEGATT